MTSAAPFTLPAALADIDCDGLVLLLDCDGVLAPIVDDPAAAAVPDQTVELVRTAVSKCALVGVVTGRPVARTRELVPVDGIWISGMHGMHIVAPDGAEDIDEVARAARPHVAVAAQTAQTVGWAYEDKDLSVTVHFRQRGALGQTVDPAMVKAQLQTVLNPLKVEIHDAKQVLEIKPRGVRTKADGVARLAAAAGEAAQTVVYVGDDLTDLDAFHGLDALAAAHPALRTVKVAVGGDEAPAPLIAAADVVLEGEAAVPQLLAALLAV
ncbi:MAG: Trehalose-6-phosphate phosphatase [Thermoleophilia bacterium]|nr:Trehalose-6-phosphate phosphatase [Thermoleophilia bacterium]